MPSWRGTPVSSVWSRPLRRSRGHEALARTLVTAALLALLALAILPVTSGERWLVVWSDRRSLLRGLWATFWISSGSLALGFPIAFVAALGRMSRRLVPNQIATVYVELIRGTPLLVQLLVAYYCLAPLARRAGLAFLDNRYVVAVAALALFVGAYLAEILRAGIESIDPGQTEAASSLGLTRWQTLRWVILPQCWRRLLPPFTGQFINNVKDSSLLSIISVDELSKITKDQASAKAISFEYYIPLALLYLAITLPLSYLNRRLEERLRVE